MRFTIGKMIYNLLQHSQWNWKYDLFILWKYKSKAVAKKFDNHICKLLLDEEYLNFYNFSAAKFKIEFNNKYNKKNIEKLKDGADKSNYGITHFENISYLIAS